MIPQNPLPISDEFSSVDEYIDSLLRYVDTTDIFQILAGGIHILDFFTVEPGLFQIAIPIDWQPFLMACEPMVLLDFLLREDLDTVSPVPGAGMPPQSLVQYVKDIRKFSLRRSFSPGSCKLPVLPRHVTLGMNVKKIHEVTNFAGYVDTLAENIAAKSGRSVTHCIDLGSGQNYLGRALASSPYSRHVIAVESKQHNITGAKTLDVKSGLAEAEKAMRNKKVYQQIMDAQTPLDKMTPKALRRIAKPIELAAGVVEAADLRPLEELKSRYIPEEGKGFIHYVEGRLESGDLSDILSKVAPEAAPGKDGEDLRLMAISIHSCGNLSHFGIRSLVMNPSVQAVAIVGCCYNLMTEKLGPATRKTHNSRPTMQALNRRLVAESERRDPQGYPLSERVSSYNGGVRLNITARMMACQAPDNWTKDSETFFVRHFFRAVLQKLFLDKGVISKVLLDNGGTPVDQGDRTESPFNMTTNPVVIGTLRKACYRSFTAYVRGAVKKLTTDSDYSQYSAIVAEKMGDITDEEIDRYEQLYAPRKREMSSVWSLMAFTAGITESLIVTDRWLFLKEHADIVQDCWVETVFDYRESPRNLVVVGVKR